MAYYTPDGTVKSNDADFLIEAIRSGLIDSLHSWGDFNNSPPKAFSLKELAGKIIEEFCASDIEIRVWINHGSPNNRQNLKARLQQSYQGDDPSSPYYTGPMLKALGIRFYWPSELINWPLSSRTGAKSFQVLRILAINFLKNWIKKLTGRQHLIRNASTLLNLCEPVVLRDGTPIFSFNRFNRGPQGLWDRPSRHTLRYSLAPFVLNDLIEQEGYLILYTHLGMPNERCNKLFPSMDERALIQLANLYHDGIIWVAPTGHLLTFWFVRHYLKWKMTIERQKIIINLLNVDDPNTGPRLPEIDELAGLCFYTPRPKETFIRMNGREITANIYPPDQTGECSIGIAPAPPPGVELLDQ